jgi:ligand-binding sensor domain-containing protein
MTRRLLMALGIIALAAPTRLAAERLPLRNYRTADGLPHDRVKSIVRDSRGFLWFCTVEGLARFDGYRFTRYTVDDGLPNQSVNDIIEESPGTYWIGFLTGSETEGMLGVDADGSRFTTIPLSEGFLPNRVNAVQLDRKGRVWAGTDDGLFWVDGRASSPAAHREQLPANTGSTIRRLLTGHDGSLWIATGRALLRRATTGEYLVYTVTRNPGCGGHRRNSSGRIWVGGTGACSRSARRSRRRHTDGSLWTLRHSRAAGAITLRQNDHPRRSRRTGGCSVGGSSG